MSNKIIDEFEKSQMKRNFVSVHVGDKVKVGYLIKEGKKERIQYFEGLITEVKKAFSRKSFTVRKIVGGIGVEKTYLMHSPNLKDITILSYGDVKKAKLFYLRDRIGSRATTVKTKSNMISSKKK